MKKLIILLTFLGMCSASYAKTFDDWSNEDLCRWVDALQVPDPILLEIEIRDLVCLANPEKSKSQLRSLLLQNTEHCFLHLLLIKTLINTTEAA